MFDGERGDFYWIEREGAGDEAWLDADVVARGVFGEGVGIHAL